MKKFETIAGRTIITRFTDTSRKRTEKKKRKPKTNPTPAAVAKVNRINQERELTASLNHCFRNGDRWLTLSYLQQTPLDTAMRLVLAAKKKMQRLCKKAGIEFKCIESTGIGSQSGKPHHHLVINQEVPWDIIIKCWDEAQVFERRLSGDGNYQRIAKYMLKNAEETKDRRGRSKKAYRCTRTITKPETVKKELSKELRLDPEDLPVRRGFYIDRDSIRVYEHPITEVICVEYIQISLDPDKRLRKMAGGKRARPEPIYPVDWGDQISLEDVIAF